MHGSGTATPFLYQFFMRNRGCIFHDTVSTYSNYRVKASSVESTVVSRFPLTPRSMVQVKGVELRFDPRNCK